MKRLLVVIYILGVLLLSAATRADSNPFQPTGIFKQAKIESAEITKNGELRVTGWMPSPCHTNPELVPMSVDTKNRVLTFAVFVISESQFCIDKIGDQYRASYNLRDLPLRAHTSYKMKLINGPSVDESPVFKTQEKVLSPDEVYREKVSVVGRIVPLPQRAEFAVMTSDQQMVPVTVTPLDIGAFAGKTVWMAGYEVQNPHSAFQPVSISTVEAELQ
jgi:hypothetical protein